MNKRRIELFLIDTLIMGAVYGVILALDNIGIGSMSMDGEFSILKFSVLYVCVMCSRFLIKIYGNIWRYANVTTYLKLTVADLLGGIVFFLIGRLFSEVSVGFAYNLITVLLIVLMTLLSRFAYQFIYAYANRHSDTKLLNALLDGETGSVIHKINVAIVGAGNVGATLADELIRNPRSYYMPFCFIDRDINKIGNGINGIRVYPEDDEIIDRIKEMPIQEIIIALPDATPEDHERLYNLYKQTDCKVKIYDYLLGEANGRRVLRDFKIEDLLFRNVLTVNSSNSQQYYAGKTILVTGGGGSIGSELCRQIAELRPKKLVILDIYENNAYEIQQELIRKYGGRICLETVIASVRDTDRLDEIFDEIKPDIVIHAAAHKHVPLMEESGCEAIKNNVFGTYNTANMAEKYGVQKFLLISTDKAVNPTNIMGASKRLCEMIIQCRSDSRTEFAAVRFGNVLGSNGSVIPLFKRQIESGGPITITDKRIIRYFMTISEAAGLVLETGTMARNGELFVLNMGKPVKILDLAENMIRLSGLKPYEDIEIEEIGLRPGEKLYEELLMKTEELDRTSNDMIFIERDKRLSREEVEEKLQILKKAIQGADYGSGHHDDVIEAIQKTVPTYCDPNEVNKKAGSSNEMAAAI